jgi:hypothetical protein
VIQLKKLLMMIQQRRMAIFFIVMVAFLFSMVVFADSDERPATPAEKAFYASVMNTFNKSLPPKPEGWDQTIFCSDTELARVTVGLEQYPLKAEYFIGWQDTKAINAGQERLNAGLTVLAKTGDFSDQSIRDLQIRVLPHDVKVRIDLQANILSLGIYEAIKPAPAIADGLVYRSESKYDSSGSWSEGATYIFLGKGWRMDKTPSTYMNFTLNKSAPYLSVQSIVVKIYADPNRAQMLAQKMDWDSLKKLIKN